MYPPTITFHLSLTLINVYLARELLEHLKGEIGFFLSPFFATKQAVFIFFHSVNDIAPIERILRALFIVKYFDSIISIDCYCSNSN